MSIKINLLTFFCGFLIKGRFCIGVPTYFKCENNIVAASLHKTYQKCFFTISIELQ